MNRDKQIEEMALTEVDILANDLNQHCADLAENYCGGTTCLSCLAHALTAKGYRKSTDVAEKIFAEIDRMCIDTFGNFNHRVFAELKKKYTQDKGRDKIAEFGKYSPLSWRNTEDGE